MESAKERREWHDRIQLEEDLASAEDVMEGVRLPGATIPPHIKDFLNKSIEEYKRLTLSSEKAKTLFLKKTKEKEEGMFPTCLRVKPPKLTIGDEQMNTIFQDKMWELCETYKKGLQDAYLQSLESTAKALENKVNQYPAIFDENLNQAFLLLADCKMVDSWPIPRTPYSTSLSSRTKA